MQEVIVKYNGDIAAFGYKTEILNNNYAILTLPEAEIPLLNSHTEIEYTELPKRLSLSISESAGYICIPAVQSKRGYGLSGEGVIVAVIDSGIDYRHNDFRTSDGNSRIAYIWDQTLDGNPPAGFLYGAEFDNAQINDALGNPDPYTVVPHQDNVGHGTAIAGIAAGNGRSSEEEETGVAPRSTIIAVRLGERDNARFARTTEIMRAIKYVYDKARGMNKPLAVNISYGTNDGAHDGNSLFETYINDMCDRWKSVIVVASGNEGVAKHHFQYKLYQGESTDVFFSVGTKLSAFTISVWKNFADLIAIEVIAPNGITTGELKSINSPAVVHLGGVALHIKYTQPNHYNQNNSIAYTLEVREGEITQGLWTMKLTGADIVNGRIDIWLPTTEEVSDKVTFMVPSAETTLTIPSSAEKVITVGGYNTLTNSAASFSGRGYTRDNVYIKPDLAAPAVNVRSCLAGGGYGLFTGTSMAAPFVTGSAALIMEWGIVQGNDPYLYGQRIKAFLKKGAGRDLDRSYPNNQLGYGSLCLKETMDYLKYYTFI